MPESAVQVIKPAFKKLVDENAKLVQIASGMGFTEGCCYVPNGDYLIWSDIPNNRIYRWSEEGGISVFREPCGNTNGHTVDREGRILSCETSGRQVSITELDGSVHPYIHQYGGRKLTSPNDIIVKSDGSVWFSDPDYGALHPELGHGELPDQETNRVYRFDPETRRVRAVIDDMDKPNGLAFSLDESILYVGDTARTHGEEENHHVMAFDVVDGERLANRRLFAEVDPWVPDGMRIDVQGNLWIAAGDGVQCHNPKGELIGKIKTPQVAANLSFGRPDRKTLFITATDSVWAIPVLTAGAKRPNPPAPAPTEEAE
ncbi:MAG: SMP-30/gluconolactonase/LRE family protein [Chloroflexi bacterium]|nr:SMP-30/gluconolactonase/LRE family protein [Chloroflexota bacterium]